MGIYHEPMIKVNLREALCDRLPVTICQLSLSLLLQCYWIPYTYMLHYDKKSTLFSHEISTITFSLFRFEPRY